VAVHRNMIFENSHFIIAQIVKDSIRSRLKERLEKTRDDDIPKKSPESYRSLSSFSATESPRVFARR
jgi:hypothetical protein